MCVRKIVSEKSGGEKNWYIVKNIYLCLSMQKVLIGTYTWFNICVYKRTFSVSREEGVDGIEAILRKNTR